MYMGTLPPLVGMLTHSAGIASRATRTTSPRSAASSSDNSSRIRKISRAEARSSTGTATAKIRAPSFDSARCATEVGAARAKELILLCDRIDAAEAMRIGLVNRVVDDARLDAAVDDWAGRLASKAPWALHMTKTQFRAYGKAAILGDVTEGDGDLLAAASAEDPGRFAMTPKGKR